VLRLCDRDVRVACRRGPWGTTVTALLLFICGPLVFIYCFAAGWLESFGWSGPGRWIDELFRRYHDRCVVRFDLADPGCFELLRAGFRRHGFRFTPGGP